MVPVTVSNLSISNVGFVMLLKSQQDDRTLPIFIGVPEAQAIALFFNKVQVPRPMTHDLMKNVLDVLEARLEHVEVCDLDDGTFYGKLVVSFEGQTLEIDSRPSDAVALALRCKAPILVSEKVMDEAAVVLDGDKDTEKKTGEPVHKDPVAMLKGELQKAIAEERYEDAARLRDEIKRATSTN